MYKYVQLWYNVFIINKQFTEVREMYNIYYLNSDFEEVTFSSKNDNEIIEFLMNCPMKSRVTKTLKNGKEKPCTKFNEYFAKVF
jgi:hypothetical protein